MDDFGKKTTIVVLGCLFWGFILSVVLMLGLYLSFEWSRRSVDVDVSESVLEVVRSE